MLLIHPWEFYLTYSISNDAQAPLRNKAYMDQTRADILRRAQEMELEDAEDEVTCV